MSILDAYRNYRSLTNEQRALLVDKATSGSRTPAEWLAFLGGVAAYDSSADRLRTAAGWTIAACLVLAIVSLAAASAIGALVVLAVGIGSVILFVRLKRNDVPNNMRECVLPLVALLREEMEPGAALRLRLDLTGGMRKEKQTGAESLPPGNFIRAEETSYTDPWFEGDGTFADGSNVGWSVVDMIRRRDVTKRGRSGKIKSKTKFKVRRMLDVRVAMRQDAYALADTHAAGGRGHDRVAVKEGQKRNVVKFRRIMNDVRPDPPLDPKHIFDLLAEAYKRVTLNQTEG
jgi:hypothetical protein